MRGWGAAAKARDTPPERLLPVHPSLLRLAGSFTPPEFLAPTLRGILATDPLEAVKAEVGKRAAVQTAIVAFVEYSLALPAEEAAGLAGNGPRCAMLRDLAEAASADCLADGRTRSPSLLPAVANLAACAELQAQRGSPDQGSFLMACLELHAVLQHDFFERQRGEGRLQVTDDQLRAMGCLGGLPLLCTLSAEVAAAAPGSGGSGGFGPWCWREAARDWQVGSGALLGVGRCWRAAAELGRQLSPACCCAVLIVICGAGLRLGMA